MRTGEDGDDRSFMSTIRISLIACAGRPNPLPGAIVLAGGIHDRPIFSSREMSSGSPLAGWTSRRPIVGKTSYRPRALRLTP